MPKTWPIAKKENKFITRPFPGMDFELSLPLNLVFRDLLNLSKTTKESKQILIHNYVFVNGIQKKDVKQLLGLFDVLELKGINKAYRLLLNQKNKLYLSLIDEKEVKMRPNKIVGKTILKKGRVQLNFMNGYNIIVEKDEFKVGDVLLLELPEKKIKDVFTLEKGVFVYLIGGKHVGKVGKVEDFDSSKLKFKIGNELYETDRRHSFVIGKDKPIINVEKNE